MSYNQKKFLDYDGLVHLLGKFDDYPTNDILGTVINSIDTALAGKVDDVQANGVSIVNNGIANIPQASTSNLGLVKFNWTSGIKVVEATGVVAIDQALSSDVKAGTHTSKPIVPLHQHEAAFYGLAKAAGDTTQVESTSGVGTYTSTAKGAIQRMLGVTNLIAPSEIQYTNSNKNYKKGQTFTMNGLLYKATADITAGSLIIPDTNCTTTNVNDLVFAPKETSILVRPSYLVNRISDVTLSAQINTLRANRLAFLPADQIIIEKTTDGGVTWEDAEIPDNKKTQLFSELRPSGITLPQINGEKSTLCGLRVTFTAMQYDVPEGTPETEKYNYWNTTYVTSRERYNTLREFYFWINSDADTMTIKAERAKGNSTTTWEVLFDNNDVRFNGWSGNDYISFTEAEFGGGTTQTSQPWNYRLTFMTAYRTGLNEFNQSYITTPQQIYEIRGYGSCYWTPGNNYAGNDHIYTFDMNQNVYFPRSVNATNFNGTINGYDVRKNVPANAVFTDTTYESKIAASGGTAVSLVTTGEKYTWNQKVGDVQVNGASVVSNGTATIPLATNGTFGLVRTSTNLGVYINNENYLNISGATSSAIKSGDTGLYPLTPQKQHESVFYGLTKAAGVDMASSSNEVGTYTTEARAAIRSMIGAENGDDLIKVQDTQPSTSATKLWMLETAPSGVQVPTVAELEADYVSKTMVGNGLQILNGKLVTDSASLTSIKNASNSFAPIVSSHIHDAAFYGLAKAAGDTTQALSDNAIGTYTEEAKGAIRNMLGAVGNTDIATSNTLGLVKSNSSCGVGVLANTGGLYIEKATSNSIKSGSGNYQPLVPSGQHEAVFYGLSKVAGVDLASETVTLGTYPTAAQNAIQTMLGIEKGIELIETVSGTTPSITGQPNTTYQCGEVLTLSITPPANGTIDVYFTSGSTATTLTVPSTVLFPVWFDSTALETDTIYEIMITNGTYGSVMTWQS